MGDGVLAYFGYPRAHEDDAERAVRAGLGSIDAVGRLDVRSTGLFGGSLQDTNNFRRELSSTPMTVAASPFRGCVSPSAA